MRFEWVCGSNIYGVITAGGKKKDTNISRKNTSSTRRQFAEIHEILFLFFSDRRILMPTGALLLQFSFLWKQKRKNYDCFYFPAFWCNFSCAVFFFGFFYSTLGGQDAINLNPIIRQSGSGQGPLTEVYLFPLVLYLWFCICIPSMYRGQGEILGLKSIHLAVFCWRGSPRHSRSVSLPLGSWPPEGIYRRGCDQPRIVLHFHQESTWGTGNEDEGLLQLTRCMKCLNWCWTILPPDWAHGWRVKRREK